MALYVCMTGQLGAVVIISLFIGVWLRETLKLKRELYVCVQQSMKQKH